jgi:hypothetical protein
MKNKTNKALLKKLVGDTLDEAFMLTALDRYCHEILSDSTEWNKRSLINQDLWKVIAQRNLNLIEEHYK